MEDQVQTEPVSTTTSQPTVKDGGSANEVTAQLDQAQKAYQGMQRKYNSLFEEAQGKDAEIENLSQQMADFQRQIDELNNKAQSAQQQASNLSTEKTQFEQQYSQAQAERDMWRLISTKYQGVGGIVENLGLSPKDSVEATEEMLAGVQRMIDEQIQGQIRQQVNSYNSTGGNIGKPQPLTQEQLRKEMNRTAGTSEYAEVSKQYYALVEQSGDYPKPKAGPYDHLM